MCVDGLWQINVLSLQIVMLKLYVRIFFFFKKERQSLVSMAHEFLLRIPL